MKIERKHGRIYFGEGGERWSVTDPEAPAGMYSAAHHAADWLYIIDVCPTTALALEKVRLIRRALRTVEREPMKGEAA